tara:strand:- start:30 stop:260 length:231 start_codon:yes stop_codon:yes gene_type:complete
MKHTNRITRDYGEGSYLTAYIFKGKYDFEAIQEYFEVNLNEYFGNSHGGAGSYYQNCFVSNMGSRTIAYVDGGLDI